MNRLRKHKETIAPILSAFVFAIVLLGSAARSAELRDFFLFGEKGVVFCEAVQNGSTMPPDHGSQTHHDIGCCILCVASNAIRSVDVALLPSVLAYAPISIAPISEPQFFDWPEIALTDGVFPYDISIRAPPVFRG